MASLRADPWLPFGEAMNTLNIVKERFLSSWDIKRAFDQEPQTASNFLLDPLWGLRFSDVYGEHRRGWSFCRAYIAGLENLLGRESEGPPSAPF